MATNDKDRLGDKLRQVERGREDQYFAERDRQLVEQLRRGTTKETEEKLKEVALLRCPKCGTRLGQRRVRGVSVDECPSCHGVWLDEGELQQIASAESEGWIARWLRREFPEEE